MDVKISIRKVGLNHGVEAVIKSGRKVVAKSPVRPNGFDATARQDAIEIAAEKGWRVVE